MANLSNSGVKEPPTSARAVDEPHLKNLPRPRDERGSNSTATVQRKGGGSIVPVELEQKQVDETTAPTVTGQTPPQGVHQPTGVAHLSGLTLRFPLATRLTPGEIVVVGRKPFEVRKESLFTLPTILKASGVVVLTVFAIIGIASLVTGPSGGTVTGVVVDRLSGRIIANATVTFEGGPTMRTNAAGMYVADGMRSGSFKITANADSYEPQTGTVTRPSDGTAQLAFALSPLMYSGTPGDIPVPSEQLQTEEQRPDNSSTPLAYGNIDVKTDFNDYLVFVDGELYGKDAKQIKRMSAGDHRVVLQLEGFEDFSKDVEVRARTTQTLSIAKSDLTPRIDPFKRAKAHFAEAKAMLDRGLWAQAIEKYNLGLADDSRNADAIQDRGWAYFKQGNHVQARADFLQAARLHEETNHYLNAVACMGHLIELEPQNAEAFLQRSKYYTAMREYGKSVSDCESAVKIDRKSERAQLSLAEACFTAGDYKRAAKEFDKARKLTDKPADTYARMLISLARGGEDEQVRKKYKEFTNVASPEQQKQLRTNPDWLRVLQIVDPTIRSDG